MRQRNGKQIGIQMTLEPIRTFWNPSLSISTSNLDYMQKEVALSPIGLYTCLAQGLQKPRVMIVG